MGDVHLGRIPRVPEDLEVDDLGPRAAFQAVVATALERRVRAVVFLGDVVDRDEAFAESWSQLLGGLRELTEAGIEVFAVVGNHDHKVLPRLADELPGLRLIGRGGAWEDVLLEADGEPWLRLCGWSFPGPRVTSSPLASFSFTRAQDAPRIGLLHADVDSSGGHHAPVARHEFEGDACDAWLLGHHHGPWREGLAAERPLGYLGSVVGLDPTETGVHGPWLLELDGARTPRLTQLPVVPLVWESIELDVEGLAAPDELESRIARGMREHADARAELLGDARVVGCRVRLVGSHVEHAAIAREAARLRSRLDQFRPTQDGREWFLDALVDAARPALDLEALARTDDPPGLIARKLLDLRAEGAPELLRAAQARLERTGDAVAWSGLERPPLEPADTRERLERAGYALLEAMLERAEGAR